MPGRERNLAPLERFEPDRAAPGLHSPRRTPLYKESRRAHLMSSNLRKALAEIIPTESKDSPEGLQLLEEIHSSSRRLSALVALVPFLGPLRIARLEGFRPQDKAKLMRLSVAVTALAAIWIVVTPVLRGLGSLQDRVDSEIRVLGNLAETYKAEHKVYPSIEVWQRSLQQSDTRFVDPWGRPYLYDPAVEHVSIGTLGRDGVPGGNGDDADRFEMIP